MKYYGTIGTSQQTVVKDNIKYTPNENEILMAEARPSAEHIAREDGTWYIPEPTLEELKEAKLKEAGALFAQKRDAIRQVTLSDGNTYGFDTANEDITNFMASWKAAEMSGSTMYKVWLADGTKGMITMQLADFTTVFNAVRDSQYEAYAWYEAIKVQVNACTTKEELEAIILN